MQAEGEVGGGEDSEGLDEGVGDGLVAGEVGVKLVAMTKVSVREDSPRYCQRWQATKHKKWQQWNLIQIELIIIHRWTGGIHSPVSSRSLTICFIHHLASTAAGRWM